METLMNEYGQFKPLVAAIRANTTDAEFIGEGSESRVWRAIVADTDYVVKLAIGLSTRGRPQNIARVVKGRAETALRVVGVEGLEQISAVSLEDGASVYEYARGEPVIGMTAVDADRVTDRQLEALQETVEFATDANIMIDGMNSSGGNAFYETENGFTLIDYREMYYPVTLRENTVYALKSLGAIGIVLASRMDIELNREK